MESLLNLAKFDEKPGLQEIRVCGNCFFRSELRRGETDHWVFLFPKFV